MGHLTKVLGVASGVAFAAFPLLRPWGDKTGEAATMVEAFADQRWVGAHGVGMLAWVLLAAFAARFGKELHPALALGGLMAILPFYGAETFGLHAMATTGMSPEAATALREGPVQVAMFGLGLLALAAWAVTIAWRDRHWTAIAWAAGIATYLPQFMAAPEIRIAHGIGLGLATVLWVLRTAGQPGATGDRVSAGVGAGTA